MKRLEISKLMDGYTDDEFFPDGGETADTETVKARVLARVEAPAKKRRSPVKLALLAAALAVGCVLCIAAGLPDMVYHMLSGTMSLEQIEKQKIIGFQPNVNPNPVVLRDGRFYLITEDGQVDITDRIDLDTAYICDYSDPEAGIEHYLIIGGIPGSYGWLEWISVPDTFYYDGDDKAAANELADSPVTAYNSKIVTYGGEYSSSGTGKLNTVYSSLDRNFPWLRTALESLGIGGVNSSGKLVVGGRLN